MFNFCRSIKKWVVTVVIWAQLQIPLSYATQQTLWFEIDRDAQTQLLHLKMYHSSSSTDFDTTTKNLLTNYALTFDNQNPYTQRLENNFIFQSQATSDFYTISLSHDLDKKVDLVIYQDGRVVVNSLIGTQNDYEIKTFSSLITALNTNQSTSVHSLNLMGTQITNQQQLNITHKLKAITFNAQDTPGQFCNQEGAQLSLPIQSDFECEEFLNRGQIQTFESTTLAFQGTKVKNQGHIYNYASNPDRVQGTNLSFKGFHNFDNQSLISSQARLAFSGHDLINQGHIKTGQGIEIILAHQLQQKHENAHFQGHNFHFDAQDIELDEGDLFSGGSFCAYAKGHIRRKTDIGHLQANSLYWQAKSDIDVAGFLDVTNNVAFVTDEALRLFLRENIQSMPDALIAQIGGRCDITADRVYNEKLLRARHDINMTVAKGLHTEGRIESEQSLVFNVGSYFTNRAHLRALNKFFVQTPAFDHQSGLIQAQNMIYQGQDIKLMSPTDITKILDITTSTLNYEGSKTLSSGESTTLRLNSLNIDKPLNTAGDLSIYLTGSSPIWNILSDISVKGDLVLDHSHNSIQFGREDGPSSKVLVQGKISITGNRIDIANGGIAAKGNINLASSSDIVIGRHKVVPKLQTSARSHTRLTSFLQHYDNGDRYNFYDYEYTKKNRHLHVVWPKSQHCRYDRNTLTYHIDTFSTNGCYLISQADISLQAQNQLLCYGGDVQSSKHITLRASSQFINNSGKFYAGQDLNIVTPYILNQQLYSHRSGHEVCAPFYMGITSISGIKAVLQANHDINFIGVGQGANHSSTISAGGTIRGHEHIQLSQLQNYVSSAITAHTFNQLYGLTGIEYRERWAQHWGNVGPNALLNCLNTIPAFSSTTYDPQYYAYQVHVNDSPVLSTLSAGALQYTDIPCIDFSQAIVQAGSFQAHHFGTMTVGQFTNLDQPTHVPFAQQQFLIDFTQISQFYQENLASRVAIFAPPPEWQEKTLTMPIPVVIGSDSLSLNQDLPRLFDVTLEAEGIDNALRANGIAPPVLYPRMTPIEIHAQFSANAQFVYRVMQGLATPQDQLEINRIIALETEARREFDQHQKTIAPAVSELPTTLLLPAQQLENSLSNINALEQITGRPKYQSPYEILSPFGGPSVFYDQPLLFHYISNYKGIEVLSPVLVFPRSWEEKTKNIRSLQGSVVTGDSNLQGDTLDIFGTYEVKERGDHTVDQTTIHAQVNVKTVTLPTRPTIGWWQKDKNQPQSHRIFEVVQSGQLMGETVEFHGHGLHTKAGSKILLDNAWFDTEQLLNQGVIRVKEYCFLDTREVINHRLQHLWDETHIKTIKKKKWGGLSSHEKTVIETFHCAESYPLDISGTFRVGNLYTQMMPQNIFSDRPQEGEPSLLKSHNQGGLIAAEEYLSKYAQDLISCSPNKDVHTQAYASKKSNFHSSVSVSGAMGVVENKQPAYVSGGHLTLQADRINLIAPLVRSLDALLIHGDRINEILATIDQQELPTRVTKNKGQISVVSGHQEVATVGQVGSERAGVGITTGTEGTARLQAPEISGTGVYIGGMETVDGQVKRAENLKVFIEAVSLKYSMQSTSDHATGLGKSTTTTTGNKIVAPQITLTSPSDLPLASPPSPAVYTTEDLEAEIRQIMAQQPLLRCHNAQGEPETSLIEDDTPEDGDCALHCLGMRREEAVRLLKDHGQRDGGIRKLVRPDLYNYVTKLDMNGTNFFAGWPHLSARKKTLEDQQHSKLLALSRFRDHINDRLVADNKERIVNHDIDNYLNHEFVTAEEKDKIRRLNQEHKTAADALLIGFYEDPEVYETFINTVYNNQRQWFAYVPNETSALDALCQIKGINLVIKRKDASGALKTIHRRHVNDQAVTHTLLHTMSGAKGGFYNPVDPHGLNLNHFNRLRTPTEAQQLVRDAILRRARLIAPTPSLAEGGQTVVKSQEVQVQNVESSTPVTYQTQHLIKEQLLEESKTKTSHTGLCDPNIQLMINLAAGVATAGVGTAAATIASGLGMNAVVAAGVGGVASAMVSRGLVSMINNAGNPGAVLKDVMSSDALRSYLIEGLAAGAIKGIGDKFNVSVASATDLGKKSAEASTLVSAGTKAAENGMLQSFGEHLRGQLIRNAVRLPLNATIGQQDLDEALKDTIRLTVADTVGGWAAYNIGQASYDGLIDSVTHKIWHGLAGGATGAIFNPNDPLKGAMSGAAANMMTETVAELMGRDSNFILSTADTARLSTALAAHLMNLDVGTTIHTSTLAIENNWLGIPMAVTATAKTLWEAYNLFFPDEVEGAKENVCQYIADETGLPVDQVRLIGEGTLTGTSLINAVRKSGVTLLRGLCKKSVQEIVRDQATSSKALSGPRLDHSNQGLYHPHEVRQHLENRYPGQVSSSTVPAANAKNVRLAGQRHPETGIVFDERGYPIFNDVTKFDTKISREVSKVKNSQSHMRAATTQLCEQLQLGKVSKDNFTLKQLQDIEKGKSKIEGLTWHHHQDIGRMQLIPEKTHQTVGHVGGFNMWFFKEK